MWTLLDGMRWDLFADGVQVLMCGVILVCLILNQLRYKRLVVTAPPCKAAPIFAQEMRLQALHQLAEEALESIRTAVESEQTKLRHLLRPGEVPWAAAAVAEADYSAEHEAFRLGVSRPLPSEGAGNRYEEVSELAARGMTVRQIAGQVRLPAGEVELALKLRGRSLENQRQQ